MMKARERERERDDAVKSWQRQQQYVGRLFKGLPVNQDRERRGDLRRTILLQNQWPVYKVTIS